MGVTQELWDDSRCDRLGPNLGHLLHGATIGVGEELYDDSYRYIVESIRANGREDCVQIK